MNLLSSWIDSLSIFYSWQNFKSFTVDIGHELLVVIPFFAKKFWWLLVLLMFFILKAVLVIYQYKGQGGVPGLSEAFFIILTTFFFVIAQYVSVWVKETSNASAVIRALFLGSFVGLLLYLPFFFLFRGPVTSVLLFFEFSFVYIFLSSLTDIRSWEAFIIAGIVAGVFFLGHADTSLPINLLIKGLGAIFSLMLPLILLFFLDTSGRLIDFLRAIGNSFLMIMYNFPIWLLFVSPIIFLIMTVSREMLIDEQAKELLVTALSLLFLIGFNFFYATLWKIFYTKRLHEQFDLYFSVPKR